MTPRRPARHRRRGLAPLELVLAIPLILFVLGLSVVFGSVACWRVRAQSVARDAIWSHRWPRGEPPGRDLDPRPSEWPLPAVINCDFPPFPLGPPLAALDHDAFAAPVIRGPLPGNVVVNDNLFDPTLRLRYGHSYLDRAPAALGNVLGDYQLDVTHWLFDGKWQYGQMGIGSNANRRISVLYPNLMNLSQTSGLKAQYQQAIQAIVGSPLRPDLAVLDRDEELRAWFGHYSEFHPHFPRFCSLDPDEVRQNELPRHIERIDGTPPPGRPPRRPFGVPADLTNRFLAMYRQQLWVLQNSIPPGSPAEIAALQEKIEILEDFLDYLSTLP